MLPPSFIISNGLTLKLPWLIATLSRRRWMSYYPWVPLNHWLVILAFTQLCLLVLGSLLVYNTYPNLSDSVATYTDIILRCVLSHRYSNVFNKVIMLSLLSQACLLCLPIVKHQHHFLWFVLQHKPYQ